MLYIYDENENKLIDTVGAFVTSHNGTLGETVDTLLFIRNDDALLYYTNVTVQIQDSSSSMDSLGPEGNGWGVKLLVGTSRPTEEEWEATPYGNFISIDNIGASGSADTSTHFPFWIRVITPASLISETRNNMTLVVSSMTHLA